MNDYSGTSITELAGIIATHLSDKGNNVVLVGGLAVEIYTDNLYLTHDIDMVATNEKRASGLHRVMAGIGFYKVGRDYENASTNITVECPSALLSVRNKLITTTTTIEVASKCIPILKVSDAVKDRLATYLHWRDNQLLVQAAAIILKHHLGPNAF